MKRSEVEALLPSVFQDAIESGNPLDALLDVVAALPEPVETLLASEDCLFDPRRAPEQMVAFLSLWVDMDRFLVRRNVDGVGEFPVGMGRLRELCAAAAELSRIRGTNKGMLRFLEIATGHSGFRIVENLDSTGAARPYHLLLTAPCGTEEYAELIHAIVAYEKPAYVTFDPEELSFL